MDGIWGKKGLRVETGKAHWERGEDEVTLVIPKLYTPYYYSINSCCCVLIVSVCGAEWSGDMSLFRTWCWNLEKLEKN